MKASVAISTSIDTIPFINKRLKVNRLIYTKNHIASYIPGFDPFEGMGVKRFKLLKDSWAHLFRWDILPILPVDRLKEHYSIHHGRPTKELYSIMGAILLQQMHDLTDDETIMQFSFNLQWHYALGITAADDDHSYMCARTLWMMRELMSEMGLEQELFQKVAVQLVNLYNVDTSLQRLDSTHLHSNMKKLGRVSLFVTTIKGFLRNLNRHHKALFAELNEPLRQRYMSKQGDAAFASMKPGQSVKKLQDVVEDLHLLISQFHNDPAITEMSSYTKMVRLFNEQCTVRDNTKGVVDEKTEVSSSNEVEPSDAIPSQDELSDTTTSQDKPSDPTDSQGEPIDPKVVAKENKEIPSDSLQNPSDPDATYDGHKGQGFQAQVMETCTESADNKKLTVITHVSVERAHIHDNDAVLPAIEQSAANGLAPQRILADTAYGSDQNIQDAAARGTEVIAPTMGTQDNENISLDQFIVDNDQQVIHCPQGHAPEQFKRGKNNNFVALFSASTCSGCELRERCKVKKGKKGFYLRYSAKALRLAARRKHEQSESFKKLYAMRAGIEATNSEVKQTTGLGRLRVRGMKAVRFAVTLKFIGVNIRRATAFKIRQNQPKTPNPEGNSDILSFFSRKTGEVYRNIDKYMVWQTCWMKVLNIPPQNQRWLKCSV